MNALDALQARLDLSHQRILGVHRQVASRLDEDGNVVGVDIEEEVHPVLLHPKADGDGDDHQEGAAGDQERALASA